MPTNESANPLGYNAFRAGNTCGGVSETAKSIFTRMAIDAVRVLLKGRPL